MAAAVCCLQTSPCVHPAKELWATRPVPAVRAAFDQPRSPPPPRTLDSPSFLSDPPPCSPQVGKAKSRKPALSLNKERLLDEGVADFGTFTCKYLKPARQASP